MLEEVKDPLARAAFQRRDLVAVQEHVNQAETARLLN